MKRNFVKQMVRWCRMFSIQGFYNSQSRLSEKLQKLLKYLKLPDCQHCEIPVQCQTNLPLDQTLQFWIQLRTSSQCNVDSRFYHSKQSQEMWTHRTHNSPNSNTVTPWGKAELNVFWLLQWSPEQIAYGRPFIDQTFNIEAISQVGHWECDTLICANHKGAVATKVESKSRFGRMGKVTNKASELVNSAFFGQAHTHICYGQHANH